MAQVSAPSSRRNHWLSAASRQNAVLVLLLVCVLLFQCMMLMRFNDVILVEPSRATSLREAPQEASVTPRQAAVQQHPDFYEVAQKWGTDKVAGVVNLEKCLQDPKFCIGDSENPRCRPWGHWYHTTYNRWLGPLSSQKFQFLEIGYYNGKGFDAYMEYLPQAEHHSMEIACIEHGPPEEGKWPWGNFASKNPRYQDLLDSILHCGDASQYDFLQEIWTKKMHRPDAPPLKVVVDDGAHLAEHMAVSLFYWFPRLEPGGILIVEDIQPSPVSNKFRTQLLPQVLKDLHFCGYPNTAPDEVCFPTLHPLLQSVHCEMHICVFERNSEPAVENITQEQSMPPEHALDASVCFGKNKQ